MDGGIYQKRSSAIYESSLTFTNLLIEMHRGHEAVLSQRDHTTSASQQAWDRAPISALLPGLSLSSRLHATEYLALSVRQRWPRQQVVLVSTHVVSVLSLGVR